MELVPIFESNHVSPIPACSHFKIYIPAPSLITIVRPGAAMMAGVRQDTITKDRSQQKKMKLIVVSRKLG